MTDNPDTGSNNENKAGGPPKLPRGRMYFIALLILIAVVSMYAGTWNRIKTAGFLGTGQPATMENLKGAVDPAQEPQAK